MPDAVNHPAHYNHHPSGVECITVAEHFNFCLGNVIKYIWRADDNIPIEDLEKAAWYLNREIQRRKKPSPCPFTLIADYRRGDGTFRMEHPCVAPTPHGDIEHKTGSLATLSLAPDKDVGLWVDHRLPHAK